jgi:hypothetical protein
VSEQAARSNPKPVCSLTAKEAGEAGFAASAVAAAMVTAASERSMGFGFFDGH